MTPATPPGAAPDLGALQDLVDHVTSPSFDMEQSCCRDAMDDLRLALVSAAPFLLSAAAEREDSIRLRPFSEWGEDDGNALWFYLPVCEPPFYVGTPNDTEWPYDVDPDGRDPQEPIGWLPMPRIRDDGSALREAIRKARTP